MLRKVITENQAKICITLKLISSLSPIIKKGMTCIQQINHCIAQYTCMALNVGRYEGTFTRTSNISRGLLRVNKASYLPTTRAIHCLLYRNYTHNNKAFFLTNLTFYSIRVVVYVDGHIAVIQKMRIETKHSTTWDILFTIEKFCLPDMWRFLTNHRHSYIYEV